jgi:hypothetical protein
MAVLTMRLLADSFSHFYRKFVSVLDGGTLQLAFVFFDSAVASVKTFCKATAVTTIESVFAVLR